MTITARSFCSGYLGLEMAVRQAFGDFTVLSHSDIKPAAVRLLKHHYPDIPNLGDMTRHFPGIGPITREAAELERADLMIGSWPCQGESSAGKRLGEKDPRDLWPNYLRCIAETRPKIFFGENVARITSSGGLRRAVQGLASLGYVGAWRVLSAADVGACHLRKRCFIVAVDQTAHAIGEAGRFPGYTEQGAGPRAVGLRAAESGRRNSGTLTLLPTPSVHNTRGPECRGPRSDGYARTDAQTNLPNVAISYYEGKLLPTPSASAYGTNQGGAAGRVGPVRESLDTMARNGRFQLLPTPAVADSRNTRNATAGRSEGQDHHHSGWTLCDVARADRWGFYAGAIAGHEQVLGRPAPEPTHAGLNTPRPQLAARFVEWMMMLPEGWVCDVPELSKTRSPASDRSAMLSLLGDGVVPARGASAFTFLLDHLARRLTAERAA